MKLGDIHNILKYFPVFYYFGLRSNFNRWHPLHRQPRIFLIIWLTIVFNLLLGFGKADISTAVQGALVQPSSPLTLGCHKRLYTYRITQADENGKQNLLFSKSFF